MRNVVLLCLDSVRADYFDEVACRLRDRADTTYRQCRAASGWSLPSHASMFTGELPHVHGVHTHARNFTWIDPETAFVSRLTNHVRVGVSANVYASRYCSFDSFFDAFVQVSHTTAPQFEHARSPYDPDLSGIGYADYVRLALRDQRPLRSLANGALTKVNPHDVLFSGRPWPEVRDKGTTKALAEARSLILTEETADRPVFAFLNLMDAHVPMYHHRGLDPDLHSVPNSWTSRGGPSAREVSTDPEIHQEYVQNYRQLYSASIEYLDRLVDAWVEELTGETEHETTVVVTADHGENLGSAADDYRFDHHSSLSESILHVPLLLVNPPAGYPESSSTLVSHLELGDLLVALAREEVFRFGDGPVTAEVIGHTGEDPGGAYWDRLIRCAYDGSRKTVWDSLGSTRIIDHESPGSRTTFDVDSEGFPEEDAILFESDALTTKREALERAVDVEDGRVDEHRVRQLEALGYR